MKGAVKQKNWIIATGGRKSLQSELGALPFSDLKQYNGLSYKAECVNPAHCIRTSYKLVHKYRAYFGGFFSHEIVDSRSGEHGKFINGFSYFSAKGDCGWTYVFKTNFAWPAEKMTKWFYRRNKKLLSSTYVGKFVSGKLMPTGRKFLLPQYRNLSWHYRNVLSGVLGEPYNRTHSFFAIRAKTTELDCLVSGGPSAGSADGGILKVIPSKLAAESTNYFFIRGGRGKEDPRYFALDAPLNAFLHFNGPIMGPLVPALFDSMAGNATNLRYSWGGFSYVIPDIYNNITRISRIARVGFFAQALTSRMKFAVATYLEARAASRVDKELDESERRTTARWFEMGCRNFYKVSIAKGGLIAQLALRASGRSLRRYSKRNPTKFFGHDRSWKFARKHLSRGITMSNAYILDELQSYTYGVENPLFKSRITRFSFIDEARRSTTRRNWNRRFFRGSVSNPFKITRSQKGRRKQV